MKPYPKGTRVVTKKDGPGTVSTPPDEEPGLYAVVMDDWHGNGAKLAYIHSDQLRRQTFFEFCFSRTGFGKTPWVQAVLIFGASAAMLVVGAATAQWIAVGFGVAILALMVWQTHRQFTGKQV